MSERDSRRFVRHPTAIPVEVTPAPTNDARRHHARNVSLGGLSLEVDSALAPGSVVSVRIASVEPAFETLARVVWCRSAGAGFELGVAFLNAEDAFRARMVEQLCHIESYRRAADSAGRTLDAEEAAREWIARFATAFPNPDLH